MSITHAYVSTKADPSDSSIIGASKWNAEHVDSQSVMAYGAVGDGSTDDTAAIQAAVDAVADTGGVVYFPPGTYLLSETISISPPTGTQVYVSLTGEGEYPNIVWGGGNDDAVFSGVGWKHSTIQGIHISIPTATGVVAWDLDTTAAFGSTSGLSFRDCIVGIGSGAGNVGWRFGHVSGGAGDISFCAFHNCMVAGGTNYGVPGQVGWLNEGGNSLNHYWFGGNGWNLEKLITNVSQAGASSIQGGSSLFCYGIGGSRNSVEFEEGNVGPILVVGGRFEVGKRFYQSATGNSIPTMTVVGCEIDDYAPDDGIIFYCDRYTSLVLDNVRIAKALGGVAYTSAMVTLNGGDAKRGTLMCRGGAYWAADPFYTCAASDWDIYIQGVCRLDDYFFASTTKFASAVDVTGDRSDGAALTNLLTALDRLGIIVDSTTA